MDDRIYDEVCKETKLVLQNAATFSSLRPRQTRLIMEGYVKRKVFSGLGTMIDDLLAGVMAALSLVAVLEIKHIAFG